MGISTPMGISNNSNSLFCEINNFCSSTVFFTAHTITNNTNNKISIAPKSGTKTCNQRRSVAYATYSPGGIRKSLTKLILKDW